MYWILLSRKNLVFDIHVKSPHPKSKIEVQLYLYINSVNNVVTSLVFSNDDPGPDNGTFGLLLFHMPFL